MASEQPWPVWFVFSPKVPTGWKVLLCLFGQVNIVGLILYNTSIWTEQPKIPQFSGKLWKMAFTQHIKRPTLVFQVTSFIIWILWNKSKHREQSRSRNSPSSSSFWPLYLTSKDSRVLIIHPQCRQTQLGREWKWLMTTRTVGFSLRGLSKTHALIARPPSGCAAWHYSCSHNDTILITYSVISFFWLKKYVYLPRTCKI